MISIDSIGVQIPEIVLPKAGTDMQKWSVIACDQFTSQPEYWNKVQEIVGDAPSTYHLILPEVFLESADIQKKIDQTQTNMQEYLQKGIFQQFHGFILVERKVDEKTRFGLMLALDLEKYDYSKGSQTLIRATEGTIINRLPPRIRIREQAELEIPHIIVLIDDSQKTVIEPIVALRNELPVLYDFDLMMDSGHLSGFAIENESLQSQIISAIEKLADPLNFKQRYGLTEDLGVLLFAMGDGNHSLATAKAIWEQKKQSLGMNHPARYALVEIENVHDDGLAFEPIHRVLFNIKDDLLVEMRQYWGEKIKIDEDISCDEMIHVVDENQENEFKIGFLCNKGYYLIHLLQPSSNLPVGELQIFLDQWLDSHKQSYIDYVHGAEVICEIGSRPGNCGFYLPAMPKDQLFKTVIMDGALPRKTFSMGEAKEKRFYLEGRKIR